MSAVFLCNKVTTTGNKILVVVILLKTYKMSKQVEYIWPDIIIDGYYKRALPSKHEMCADGLMAWALATFDKDNIPSNFGIGLAFIARELCITGTGDSFMEWSNNNPL